MSTPTTTGPITVYTTPSCGQCVATKTALTAAGVEFDTVDLSADPDAYEMVTGLGYRAAPVVIAGDNHWSGFRPDRIAELVAA